MSTSTCADGFDQIYQEKIGKHLVDLYVSTFSLHSTTALLTFYHSGANWIHCTRTNPIIELAELTQTHLEDWDGGQATWGQNGKLLDEQTAGKISKFVWDTINDAFAYSEKYGDSIPPERSLLDYFCEKVEQTGFTAAEKALCLESCKLWGTYMGEPVWRQSLKFFRLEQCIDGSKVQTYPFMMHWTDNSCSRSQSLRNSHLQGDPRRSRLHREATRRHSSERTRHQSRRPAALRSTHFASSNHHHDLRKPNIHLRPSRGHLSTRLA